MLTPEQIEERKSFIGGSDCAGVMAMSRWSSPLQVWMEKTGKKEAGKETVAMEIGSELEDLVAKMFCKRTGKKVQRVNESIRHQKYSFIGANIDRRVVGEDAILECKTASAWKAKEWGNEDIPQEYILQVMHYLLVTGKQTAYIAVLIGNNDFKWKKVERDEELIKEILVREVEFWQKYVIPQKMPMIFTDFDGDNLEELFPNDNKPAVKIPETYNEKLIMLAANEEAINELEREIKKIKNELKALLGESQIGTTNKYQITWKLQTRNSIDVERLKNDMPDIYSKYLKQTQTRAFRFKKIDENK